MTYTNAEDLDFGRIEREAYIRGDSMMAQLAAVADDRSMEVAGLEENVSDLEDRVKELTQQQDEALAELRAAVRERLEAVDAVLAECKRISKRAELEAALQAVYNATTEGETT